jgi:hypothetical protein
MHRAGLVGSFLILVVGLVGCTADLPVDRTSGASTGARFTAAPGEEAAREVGVAEWELVVGPGVTSGAVRALDATGSQIVASTYRFEGSTVVLAFTDASGATGEMVVAEDGTILEDNITALGVGPDVELLSRDLGALGPETIEVDYIGGGPCDWQEMEFAATCGIAALVCATGNPLGCAAGILACVRAGKSWDDCMSRARQRQMGGGGRTGTRYSESGEPIEDDGSGGDGSGDGGSGDDGSGDDGSGDDGAYYY